MLGVEVHQTNRNEEPRRLIKRSKHRSRKRSTKEACAQDRLPPYEVHEHSTTDPCSRALRQHLATLAPLPPPSILHANCTNESDCVKWPAPLSTKFFKIHVSIPAMPRVSPPMINGRPQTVLLTVTRILDRQPHQKQCSN